MVGVYFSAHWCPPCRRFTPTLVEAYNALTAEGKSFEIVFISDDRDEKAFEEYFAHMPWLAVPYSAAVRKNHGFYVDGIPTLKFIDTETGSIVEWSSGPEGIRAWVSSRLS